MKNNETEDISVTRSQLLENKTEITNDELVQLLDLPAEKIENTLFKSYINKSYSEIRGNISVINELAEKLKTEPKYIKYGNAYIAKDKLLFENSAILYNEIPGLILLDKMALEGYLLPFRYTRDENKNQTKFADALKENVFTDFKRVFSDSITDLFRKGVKQGRDIFFIVNTNLTSENLERQLKGRINYWQPENKDKSGNFLFYLEKEGICYSFSSDREGFVTENQVFDLKEIRPTQKSEPLKFHERHLLSRSQLNNTTNNEKVNRYFKSFLFRGAIEEFKSHKEIPSRIERYFNSLIQLENITHNDSDGILKESNKKFIKQEKESQLYKFFISDFQKRSVSWKPNTRDYASYVADVINTGNKTSLAPYLRSWKAEELSVQYNPLTGQVYDSVILGTHKELIGSKDNRWLTTNEIEEFNLKIKENVRPAVLLFRQGNGTTRAIKLVNASEILGLEAEKKHAKENGDKTISPKDESLENIFIAFRKAIKEGYNYKAPSNYKYEEFSKETVLSLLKNTKISVKNQKNTILSKEISNGIIERD